MQAQNEQLARIFEQIGNLLLYRRENRFAALSYLRYARTLRGLAEAIEEVARRDALQSLPGVGTAIATKTRAYLRDGTFPLWERLQEEVPLGIRGLIREGIPPSLVRELETRNIRSPEALWAALRTGDLRADQFPKKMRAAVQELAARLDAGKAPPANGPLVPDDC